MAHINAKGYVGMLMQKINIAHSQGVIDDKTHSQLHQRLTPFAQRVRYTMSKSAEAYLVRDLQSIESELRRWVN